MGLGLVSGRIGEVLYVPLLCRSGLDMFLLFLGSIRETPQRGPF